MKRFLALFALGAATLVMSAQWTNQPAIQTQDLPAYNAAPPHGPLPAILQGQRLTGPSYAHTYQVNAYRMAAKIPNVLHQLPCYCRCDRAMGHNSLHSCFEGDHGAACSTCMKEDVYAYRETRRGRTPAQIRTGIKRGEWMNVDLEHATL